MKRFAAKVFSKLREKRGSIFPLSAAMIFLLLAIFGMAFVIFKGIILAQGTRDAVQCAAVSVVTSNYYNAYDGMRDGNSGAYCIGESGEWNGNINSGNVGRELDRLFGMKSDGSSHTKTDSDGTQYSISNLNVSVSNAPFADNNPDKKLRVNATYTLYYPISLFGFTVPANIPISVSAAFSPKF